jgi:sialate O-acetylesterase
MGTLHLFMMALIAFVASSNPDPGFPNPNDHLFVGDANEGAAFSISDTLGDHMVLQRAPASAVVWGFAPAGTVVTTVFNGKYYTSTTGSDRIWRTHLLPTEAGGPYEITFRTSNGATGSLSDVVFGDVYLCGGQSNMEFSVGGNVNASAYIKEADNYPNIRLFTVGEKTSSRVPLQNLKTIQQKWMQASSKSVTDGTAFGYFSAVCWFFGKNVYNGIGGKVPIGLISNNWGGTRIEQWMSPATSLPCGHASTGELYNAMIHPYTVGPMALTGFIWYQGESDLGGKPGLPEQNNNYTCTQIAQINQWRHEFQVPDAFYGIVQLSTWHCDPILLAELRDQQLESGKYLSNFAYATNADFGAGSNIHPPYKQYPGARLANAALSIVYKKPLNWRSPTYASAFETGRGEVTVWLNDVTAGNADVGLVIVPAANAKSEPDCLGTNAKVPRTCAWAELQFNDVNKTWTNASVSISKTSAGIPVMILTAKLPQGYLGEPHVIASRYGWGAVPMLTVYRSDLSGQDGQLPVLPWSRPISGPWVSGAPVGVDDMAIV